jgi:PBP1b-binding outer membrane lipoprotein LpoB
VSGRLRIGHAAVVAVALLLGGCPAHMAEQQKQATAALTTGTLAQRQYTTRRFDTKDETAVMAASAGVLQDLGFNIDETSRSTGLLVASKDRDAVQAGQVLFSALVIALGAKPETAGYDTAQKIRISVVSKPVNQATVVRVTIQRLVINNMNQATRAESIDDPQIYQEFFDKLSQSIFLEAHEI